MDSSSATNMRQRVANVIEEAGSLLGLIPALFDENEQMCATLESTRQEADRGREELIEIKNELTQIRKERDEMTRMCTSAMNEVADLMNETMIRLRPGQKSSPLARERATAAELAGRPTPAAVPSI
jgi:uncharacterized coiled-coil DUF342 family protein